MQEKDLFFVEQEKARMNKSDLILTVQKQLGRRASKTEAERAINVVVQGIKAGLKKGMKIQLVGFGSFRVVRCKERNGVNPRHPEIKIRIPARKIVRFSMGKELKNSL